MQRRREPRQRRRRGKGFYLPRRRPLRRRGATPKPSRAKKRNGRKTAFIKLSADVRHPPIPYPPPRPRFTPRENYRLAPRSSRLLLSRLLPPIVSFPFVIPGRPLPPWNEVGMCKIVPRCALHHRVASFLPLFLPLAFLRSPLSLPPLYSPSFSLSFGHDFSDGCQFSPISFSIFPHLLVPFSLLPSSSPHICLLLFPFFHFSLYFTSCFPLGQCLFSLFRIFFSCFQFAPLLFSISRPIYVPLDYVKCGRFHCARI